MRVAVTYDNGNVFEHFGKTEQFKVYDIEDGKVVVTKILDTNGEANCNHHEHGEGHSCGHGKCHE